MQTYARLATTQALTLKKGSASKQTEICKIVVTADGTGTLTIADGTNTYVIDVVAGINTEFCFNLVFAPGADVTLTAGTATMSVFVNYIYK